MNPGLASSVSLAHLSISLPMLICSLVIIPESAHQNHQHGNNFRRLDRRDQLHNSILEHINISVVQDMLENHKREADYNSTFLESSRMYSAGGKSSQQPHNFSSSRYQIPATSPHNLRSQFDKFVIDKNQLKPNTCQHKEFPQTFKLRGCVSEEVTNRFCYGQCNTFYIPRDRVEKNNKNKVLHTKVFRTSTACMPHKWERKRVQFHCPNRTPNIRRRFVRLVKECRCKDISD